MLFMHFFVYLACFTFRLCSLPLGVRDWLRLVIVAHHELLFQFVEVYNVCYGPRSILALRFVLGINIVRGPQQTINTENVECYYYNVHTLNLFLVHLYFNSYSKFFSIFLAPM